MNSYLCMTALQRQLCSTVRHYSRNVETYYDILHVRMDSTGQEIRSAFVQLSKKFHPDVKGATADPKTTAHFIKISEAYQILSKPSLRDAYDQDLWAKKLGPYKNTPDSAQSGGLQTTESYKPWQIRPDYAANPGPYYGFKGLNRVSNSKVAWALLALAVFGAVFGFVSVKQSFTFNQKQLDEKSAEASSHHEKIRADAEKFGNKEQLRRMIDRMMKE